MKTPAKNPSSSPDQESEIGGIPVDQFENDMSNRSGEHAPKAYLQQMAELWDKGQKKSED